MLLPGYTLDAELYRGRRRVVVRARRDADGVMVIVKTFTAEFPTPAEAASLRREFDILRSLDIPGVARAIALESHRDRPYLVLEEAGDTTLKQLVARGPLGPGEFLPLAAQLAAVVAAVHRAGIVHKDINPNNILIDRASGHVTLADFGIASRASSEPQRPGVPHLVEGTLAYMSPEQTGRMNRDLDYRSDLYSLGVTFYEMLTGRLPFESADPLELIHGHVGRRPVAPAERQPGVPAQLSDLVMKLLAKGADDRYQSAEGLAADLARCEADRAATGSLRPFRLGEEDVRDRFVIPQRLYGREEEVARLLAVFDRVAAGATELVLVSGYSGIGKTSLVQETYRALAQHRGQYAAGKFDQLARDVPYSALRQALQGLVRHLLAETDERLAEWRPRLQQALGDLGQVIVEVIPELDRLLGPQPPVPELGPAEAQNRFNLVFQRFLGALARPEHPLVLFLDDLQWADLATLSLLPQCLGNPELRGLLLAGAYRDNEVSPGHPLLQFISEHTAEGRPLTQLELAPLGAAELGRLVQDTLDMPSPATGRLVELLLVKTEGNPFFVTQFLRALHQDGLVRFDRAERTWRVDLDGAARLPMTENVVELMAGRIQRFEPATQRVLRLAACIGNQFDLGTLALVAEAAPHDAVTGLWPAVEQGLVLAEEQSYGLPPTGWEAGPIAERRFRFLHDRVQQAAYAQIPAADRRAAHLKVGRLLSGNGINGVAPERIFDAVNHLNLGAGLITDPAERRRLTELNLVAGRKAKASAAFPAALTYFEHGLGLLPPDAWEGDSSLAFALHYERAEALYLTGRLAEAERAYPELLSRTRDPLDRVDVYVLAMTHFETTSRYGDALQAGREGLRLLGIPLPEGPGAMAEALGEELALIRARLGGQPIAALVELPESRSREHRQRLKLLMACWPNAYITGDVDLADLLPARMVRLSLDEGSTPESAFGYCMHAITVGWRLGEYERAYEYGRAAIELNQRLKDLRLRAVILHRFAALVNPWRKPFASCLPIAQEAARVALDSGSPLVAGYAQFQQAWYGMHLMARLPDYIERYTPVADYLALAQARGFHEVARMMLQWARALLGKTESLASLNGADFDEAGFLASFGKAGIMLSFYVTLKLELLHTAGRLEEARTWARDQAAAAEVFGSSIWPAMFVFRHALVLAAWLPGAPESERPAARDTLEGLLRRLERWAENAPENFRHMALLARAEAARADGRLPEAIAGYEDALEAVATQASPRHRALANELYGEFWLARRQPKVAAVYLAEARFGYEQWGARAKVAQLGERHGSLLAAGATPAPPATTLQTTSTSEGAFDLLSVIKASQALTAEIRLDELLDRLMRVAVEHAGAERGQLVLEHEGQAAVHVVGTAEQVQVRVDGGTPLAEAHDLPVTLVNLVRRTGEAVVVQDAKAGGPFAEDPYFLRADARSALGVPVLHLGKLIGVLFLENSFAAGVFTPARVEVLQVLASQAAIAIENARLFAEIRRLKDRLQAENVYLIEEIRSHQGFEEIVGRSPALHKVLNLVEQVAPTDTTVLITGETGTGKELVARAVHNLSQRKDRPLVTVNCGAISPGLVESELFGHEKGAFTGAIARKIGRFELADGGTIFLDEIGDLPADLQVKLLRVLQEGEIERVGGSRPIRVNVRVIAATHRDLTSLVDEGRFRADLFYRLNVFPIRTPALRERREDVPLLVRYFVLKYAQRLGKRIESIPTEVMEPLCAYDWPGNIRELGNVLERSVIVTRGSVLELGDWIPTAPATARATTEARSMEEMERAHIVATLERTNWKVSGAGGAAAALGLKPTTLESRMKKLGIRRPG